MRKPTPRALVRAQTAIESFSLSPRGDEVVYALRGVERDRYVSHLWRVGWDGGTARRLTSGFVRDGSPAISPDGRSVAYTRAAAGDDADEGQVWILPLDGGEPWQLTRLPHGASAPRWSPDGSRLAILGPAGDDRFRVGPEVKGKPPLARRMTRTDFRDDESGFLGRRTHLWVVRGREGARARQLTRGDHDVRHQRWSHDGTWIAFVTDPGPDANLSPRSVVWRVSAGGGDAGELLALAGDLDWPAVSPDGTRMAAIGTDIADPPDEVQEALWVAGLDGGAPRDLTGQLDHPTSSAAWADLVLAEDDPGPCWLDDETLVTIVSDRGRNLPYRVTTGGDAQALIEPGRIVSGGIAAAGPDRIVVSAGSDGRAAEIHAVEPSRRALRRLTSNGSGWQRRFPLPRWDEEWVDGPGGRIQTWIVSPPGVSLDRPLPTVVIAHGGPTGASAPGGTLDTTMLAGHGYRCLLPNVRGSASFGSDWIAALGGRWGEVDAEDVLAVLDAMVDRRAVDASRVGMMGLSYGGYLTQWLVGVTDRFGAAVSENGVANQVSTWANSYFGVHYDRRARLGDPLTNEGMLQLWSSSPMRNVANVHTPLLMLQSEEDRICPAADNEQFFTALKVLDREVEYILYPEEHHDMKSSGRPDRRIDRMERILAWFERWIGPGQNPGPG